jgi:hypothetical protein
MANRFIHGWDAVATADLPKILSDMGSGTDTVAAGGRNSGNSLRLSRPSDSCQLAFDAQSMWIVGFAYRKTASLGIGRLVTLFDGTTTHSGLFVNVAGNIEIRRGTGAGTLLATGTTTLVAGTYAYIEVKLSISDTTGVVQVQVNGIAETLTFVTGNATNQDTQNAGNASANIIQFGGGTNTPENSDFDDMYINDGTGGVDDTFWGDIRVVAKSVDGAGNSAQFTPLSGANWQNVDEATPDGDTTYNESSTVNHIDSMTTDALGVAGTVKGVAVNVYARKTDAGAGSLAPLWRIGSTDYPGTGVPLSTDYSFVTQRYRVSPATSAAWTTSEIDGAQLGYKRTA